jgi:oxalate decarboxylase/phosphoglucose isomerase-like protein (cupin superfamily)
MRKTVLIVLALAALALVATGCGSDEDQDAAEDVTTALTDTEGAAETAEDLTESAEDALSDALTRDLQEQNNSGITGTVELEPVDTESIKVVIELDGSPAGASHPAHIHPGTCADLDPTPEYPLENVVDGRSETTLEASSLEVFTGEYAVNVHDADDPSRYVACANIPSASG